MRVSRQKIDLFLLCLTFFSFPFPHVLAVGLRYGCVLFLLLKYIRYGKRLGKLFFAIGAYGAVLVLSTAVNGLGGKAVMAAFYYSARLLDIFLVLTILRGEERRGIHTLFYALLSLAILTDGLMLVVPYDFDHGQTAYFVGNKFTVSYLHGAVLCLQVYRDENERKRRRYGAELFCAAWCAVVSYAIGCSTGMILCGAFFVLSLLPGRVWERLGTRQGMLLALLAVNVLVFGPAQILRSERIAALASNMFHKNASLTGRLMIYRYLPGAIAHRPLLGYGHNNTVIAGFAGTLAANAQNGVMKVLLDSGILGLVCYGGVFLGAFPEGPGRGVRLRALYAYLYAMILVSAIEISITGPLFFLLLAMARSIPARREGRESDG